MQPGCPNVVIIEDDPDIRGLLSDFLALEGYSVEAYENGKVAIEHLDSRVRPCLILLDLMMPVMNGWEFLRHRQALGDTVVAIPVYIVSAVVNAADVTREGAKGYLKKPVDLDVLLRIVEGHCGPGKCRNAA